MPGDWGTPSKLKAGSIDKLRHSLRFPHGIEVPRQGRGGGLLLLWKSNVSVTLNNFSTNHIDCFIENNEGPSFHFTGFYGHPCTTQRHHTWTMLKLCHDIAPLSPWLVLGDFNEIISNEDKVGGSVRNSSQIDAFRGTVTACNLNLLPFDGDRITWTSQGQGKGIIKERLDYGFVNDHWDSTFQSSTLQHLDYYNSDHRALKVLVSALNEETQEIRFKSRFRFERIWLQEEQCAVIISNHWANDSSNNITQLMANISTVSNKLQHWHHTTFGQLKEQIKDSHKHVAALHNSSRSDSDHLQAVQNSEQILDELLAKEEDYWHQRSRISWLQSGDSNTKFFHQHASTRKKNNQIRKLTDANGNVQIGSQALLTIISDYYQDLFTSHGVDQESVDIIIDKIPSVIDNASRTSLSSPFTATDVHNALKTMSDDKSPGLDGLSVMFYTNYWHIVGQQVTAAVLDVLNNGADPSIFNTTLITLIPKVKKPTHITQYRPISLCNVLYKLVSKAVVMRLKPFLPQVISEYQSAFISQRLITDNILVAFELLHSLKGRKRGSKGYAVIKLDMSKAFDRVEWDFVAQVMLKMGFGTTIVDLILRCLTTVSYSFMLNGSIQGQVTPYRGIRQGDPLSPYLFLICVEGLSRLLQHEESIGDLQGLKISRNAPSVSHLFFADDSVLFCRANRQSARSIHRCLQTYSKASGQVINPDKCVLSFSDNTRQHEQDFFTALLGMPIQPCHEQYLGLPSFAGRDKKKLFGGITDKIWKLLSSWKEHLFSAGGKEVLLKAVVQAIPTYAMSCFRLPVTLCHQIESMMANFWWGSSASGKSIHWKNWNFLCKAKVQGGLGFRNFIHFNQALLAKQAWRIIEFPNSLLSKLLRHRYFSNGNFISSGLGSNPSLTWRSLFWGKELLLKGLRWRVGSGLTINCATDAWMPGNTTFKPYFFKGADPNLMVADLISDQRQWDLVSLQANFSQADVDHILTIPLSLFPHNDVLIWSHSFTGIYNVKSGYQLAVSLAEQDDTASSSSMEHWWSTFWKMKIPPKVRIFVWKVFHSTLPVAAELYRRHIATSPYCTICNAADESITHALFSCPRAKTVWDLSPLNIDFTTLRQSASADILLHLSTVLTTSEFEQFLVLCWCNWHERNAIYHGNTVRSPQAVAAYAPTYLTEFQRARAQRSQPTTSSATAPDPRPSSEFIHAPKWTAPPRGRLKLNTDAAIDRACNKVGIGATLRNADGLVVAAISKPLLGNYKPEEMEALGLALSLNWLISNNLSVDFIETDSLLVVQGLLSSQSFLSAFHAILNNITFLVSSFPRAQINHVYRSANTYAHTLAKYALTVDTECIWVETFPSPLMTLM
ncbi:hypothetical protein CsatB_019288 [Cannabis sativa]